MKQLLHNILMQTNEEMKMSNLTVYDLIAEDHELWAKSIEPKMVQMVIRNEINEVVYFENSHINAWESLVSFAKQVLACDERLQNDLEIKNDLA